MGADTADPNPVTTAPAAGDTEFRRFAASTFWVVAGQVAGKLAGLVLFVIAARALERSEFGEFVFALAFTPLFFVFTGTGMNNAVVREIARDHGRFPELFASGLWLRAGIAVLAFAAAIAIGWPLTSSNEAFVTLVLVAGARLVDDLTAQHASAFRAFEQMRIYALIDLSNRTLSTVFAAVGLLIFSASVTVVAVAYLLGSVGALVLAYASVRIRLPSVDLRASTSRRVGRELLAAATPLGIGGVLNTGAFRIDTVMLQAIRGTKEVGLYGAAYSVFEALVALSWSLASVTLPAMSRARSIATAARVYERTIALILILLLPAAVVVPFAAHSLITAVFSERYGSASGALAILVVAGLLYAVAYASRIAAIAIGRRKSIAFIALITLIANVAMNAIAIPVYGFRGAAWTTLGTEVLEAAILVGLVIRAGVTPRIRQTAWIPVAGTVAAVVPVVAFGLRGFPAVFTAAAVYVPALLVAAALVAPAQLADLRRGISLRRT